MKLQRTTRFTKNYSKAPIEIQRAFDKQSLLLLNDRRHPSLQAKKYEATTNCWQARVTRDWRFYFAIEADTYILQDIMCHPK
jgi:hypothetical protein